jgi:hypothetical protein
VAIPIDSFDPRLTQAAATGRQFETITITLAGSTFTLSRVVISSVSIGADTVAVSLNFVAIDLGTGG